MAEALKMIGLVVGAGVVLAGGLLLARKSGPSVGSDPTLLPSGTLRLRVRVPLDFQKRVGQGLLDSAPGTSESRILRAVRKLAWGPSTLDILLLSHDPTDPEIWSLIVKSRGGKPFSPHGERLFQLLSFESVELPEFDARPMNHPVLDSLITRDEGEAVAYALKTDENPKHLSGFASTLEDDYPVAASLLRAKAKLSLLRRAALIREGAELADMGELPTMLRAFGVDLGRYRPVFTSVRGYKVPERATDAEGKTPSEDEEGLLHLNRAVATFVKRPELIAKPAEEVAAEAKVPKDVIGTARAMVRVLPGMVAYTTNERRGKMPPLARKPVPAAALHLAYAMRRPTLSLIESPKVAEKRLQRLRVDDREGNPQAAEAREMLDLAEKLLSRRQWIDWYRRVRDIPHEGPEPGSITGRIRSDLPARLDTPTVAT